MKAIVYRDYGSAEVVRLEDVAAPEPGDNEVLVRVRAASVNMMDCHFIHGAYVARPFTGFLRPRKLGRLGADFAGEVVKCGKDVTRFRAGDAVFGAARGSMAEYVKTPERAVAPKPANASFEVAATLTVAGLTALQGIRDKARVRAGERVLVNGAAGGVGSFAVQIAKAFSAEVTGVCSTRNLAMVKSIGADHVVDHTREDFTNADRRYDVIFDVGGSRTLWECRRVMQPAGRLVIAGGRPGGPWLGPLPALAAMLTQRVFVRQRVTMFMAKLLTADLVTLGEMVEAGTLKPVIGRQVPLSRAAEALSFLEEGHAGGKAVVTVAA